MITEWTKRFQDGSIENSCITGEEVDLSRPTMRVVCEKIVRDLTEQSIVLGSGVIPYTPDIGGSNYRAYDVKSFKEGSSYFVYVLAARPDGTSDSLYVSKFNLGTRAWVYKNSKVSSTAGVLKGSVARLNSFSTGVLWAVWEGTDNQTIWSSTSSNAGVTWTAPTAAKQGMVKASLTQSKYMTTSVQGSWSKTVSGAKWQGGSCIRSSSPNSNRKAWVQFKVTGTDLWISTYSTTVDSTSSIDKSKSPKPKHVGKIRVIIDGKTHVSVDLSKYSAGYQHYVKINKYKLTNSSHTVRIEHLSGRNFFMDGIKATVPSTTDIVLNDAMIRVNSGLDLKEALLCVNEKSSSSSGAVCIYVDRSGAANNWTGANRYVAISGTPYAANPARISLAEDNYGLWMMYPNLTSNSSLMSMSSMNFMGQTSGSADYGLAYWKQMSTGPVSTPINTQRVSAASTADGGFSAVVESNTTHWGNEVPRSSISFTPSMHTVGYSAPLPSNYELLLGSFKLAPGYKDDCVGVFGLDSNKSLNLTFISMRTISAQITNLSDYVTDFAIQHDDKSTPSTCNMNIAEVTDNSPMKDELEQFMGVLPQTSSDRDVRVFKVTACFDQGSYSYETRLFTGVLNEVKRTMAPNGGVLSLSAFDYSQVIQKFRSPAILVYANPTIEWGETSHNYPPEFNSGAQVQQPLRNVESVAIKDGDGKNTGVSVYYGWTLTDSLGVDSFYADPVAGYITQRATSGIAVSPSAGIGDHYVSARFMYPTNADRNLQMVMQAASWSTTGTILTESLKQGVLLTISPSTGIVSLAKSTGVTSKTWDSKHYDFAPDQWYQITAKVTPKTVWASISAVGSSEEVRLSGSHSGSGMPSVRRVGIGSSTSGSEVSWDSIYIYKDIPGSYFKYDGDVASDVVRKSFQSIIPFSAARGMENDYFAATVIAPGESAKDTLDKIAAQNGRVWRFDNLGRFVWKSPDLDKIAFVVTDEHIGDLSTSYNPSSFLNWIQVTSDEAVPKIVYNYSDGLSMLKYGIRYSFESIGELDNNRQAKMAALKTKYASEDGIETIDLQLAYPLIFLEPGDVIKLQTNRIKPEDTFYGYNRIYYVQSVSITPSQGSIGVSIALTSRAKAAMNIAAEQLESQGAGGGEWTIGA